MVFTKENLIVFLRNNDILKDLDLDKLLQKPKNNSQGDFSIPLFILSKKLGVQPNIISKEVVDDLNSRELPKFIEKIVNDGPFVNIYFNFNLEASDLFLRINSGDIFKIENSNPERILIEYPSPNTNKSLHIGHVRNIFLGNAISNILIRNGFDLIRTNMNNDRGIAVCKAILSYKLFSNGATPESMNMKPDEFVSYFYVLFNEKNKENPDLNLEERAQEMLVKWEEGDKEVRLLWRKLLDYVFAGYAETYSNYKLKPFDREYYESEIYKFGKDLIIDALNKGVDGFIQEEDGAIAFDFKDKTYGKKYLVRGDGTTLYITQDLYLAQLKEKEFHPDKSIFIVGKEQKYHFEVLFKILEKLNLSRVENNFHLAYGYVYDKNGNKFSSRLGNTLSADETLKIVIDSARDNLLKKEISSNLSEKEIERRSKIIGFAALSFMFLKVNPLDDIKFDVSKAISFEGETGPYVLYTYARMKSILRKANFDERIINENLLKDLDYSLFDEKERSLVKLLLEYNSILKESSNKYRVSIIANYLIKLSQSFNEFYQNSNILKSEEDLKRLRLILIYFISLIIKDGLSLYDIEVLEEM